VGVLTASDCSPVAAPKDTAINDTVYDSYHVFRSEVRVVPDAEGNVDNRAAPDGAADPKP